ncbi:hypothetical protein MATL_G00034620 [Megalops atlanticus]|uniref:RRM domain-containing protein n=1 Tax=Megalops atlanticus TaxID=7932 RepID=A0A9D3QIZ9_MEGAT|nr:hypothetical protein MATL_G00034620 [Megalops atlanticus]
MATSVRDDDFDEYDKPGAERSRRRRGDDDLDSDLEGDLLEEDWLTARKNPSDVSDEELNDDLLQSDEEDQTMSGQGVTVSLNATADLGTSFDLNDQSLEDDYVDGDQNLGVEDYEGGDEVEGYSQEEYADDYGDHDAELVDDQAEYAGDQAEDEIYQDEVVDIEINDPSDDEFQVDDYSADYSGQQLEVQVDVQDVPENEEAPDSSQIMEAEEMENETEQEEEVKEESDEEEDEDEESGRLRFKTERKDATVVRLSDAASKRRNIPETLELSEEAKADLLQFEEKERQRRQGRFGGRGRGRGGMRGRGGYSGFGMADFRNDGAVRGRMNDQRPSLMTMHMGMQPHSRMPPHHHQHHQQAEQHQHQQQPQQFQPPPRGPFQAPGQQQRPPPQPLIPPHLSHRPLPGHGAPVRAQMESPRMMSPPPASLSPQQPKNIHINPHFRGPASSPAQVPLMPAQNQPRPAVGPPRFPGPGDFQQQHMPGNFNQPPRPHHPEPWRGPPAPQEREPFFIGEPRFPGQHMFDQQSPAPLMNNNHPLPGQNPMAFNQSGPGFNQQGPQPMFQREAMRPGLPPPGPLGMSGLGQHGPPTPRHFMPHRPQFSQPGPPLPPQHMQFGMQVRPRGLMHPSPHPQPQQHEALGPQQQQHPLLQPPHQAPQHLQHPLHGDLRPIMHHAQPPFRQQLHAIQPQTHPRAQHPPPRASPIRPRMNSSSPNVLKPPMQQVPVLPQRNSNLRELPVAPSDGGFGGPARPGPGEAQVRPAARPAQGARPGQNARGMPAAARPQLAAAKAQPAARMPERTVVQKVKKEAPSLQTGPPQKAQPEDPDEDEETRLYRLKIEEQKRLREEILKRKELRRQLQAGMRKKELLERISSQQQQQQQQQQSQPPAPQQPLQLQPQPVAPPAPMPPSNGTAQPPQPAAAPTPAGPRPNVKNRLQLGKPAAAQGWPGGPQQAVRPLQPGPDAQAQWQQKKAVARLAPGPRPGPQFQSPEAAVLGQPQGRGVEVQGQGQGQGHGQGRPQELKPGVKRTVMQRANSGGTEVPQKVRVVKILGGGGEAADGPGPVQQQQRIQQVPRQPPQLRQVPLRKVTMGNANLQQLTPHAGRGGAGTPLQGRVVVQGRGRGGAGQMGRGRGVPSRQSPRVMENQPCMVSIEGLSSSTTDVQLKNLLKSIGPIQMFKMLPQQRKAIAKFINPQHAASFQQSFHRHMIDLSHIDVSLIDG